MTPAIAARLALKRSPKLTTASRPSRVPSKPASPSGFTATPAGFTQLAAGTSFLKQAAGTSFRKGGPGRRALKRGSIGLLIAVVAVICLWELFIVAVNIATTDMWFDSVHAGSVYKTMIEARMLLFAVFAVAAGLVGGLTTILVCRIRPLPLSQDNDTFRWTFRKYEPRVRRLIVLLGVLVPAILVGRQASSGWQTYLLWRHATPFHTTDPTFHKDVSFYVEVLPFHQMVVSLLQQTVTYGLWIAVIGGYWYAAWRLRRGRQKVTRGFTQLMSVLLGAYLACMAVNYWLSRYAITISARGPVTGAGYTDTTAGLPSKYVMMAMAIGGALVLFADAVLASRVRYALAALVVVFAASQVIGSAWPGLVYHYREAPSAAKLDLGEITNNQKATRAAFGLENDITTLPQKVSKKLTTAQLVQLADTVAQTPLIDPNQLTPTFNVQQQLQAYYGFKSTLDTSHYDIDGKSQDVVLAVRELRSSGIPKQSWVNSHLVYTHGYGVVAAPTTEVDANTASPTYLDGGMPPGQQIPVTRPQVYFGQAFGPSAYAIVGQPGGSHENLEFDHPGGTGSSSSAHTTYKGNDGIPIGSTLRRVLFAVQLHDPNILFSSEINSASHLLEIRNPSARVARVAPWLTLDGDVYPAVVDGQIKWIVDGYTTTSHYPDSQLVNVHAASKTTLTTASGASVAQQNTQINYLKNSVKAVVDAYTGQVSLYEWNLQQDPDPLLKAWEAVYPGLVKPQSSIPPALLSQLRYPTDLFNVQRSLLTNYHVTQAPSFYSGNDFWTVPTDPTVAASNSLNAGSGGGSSSPPIPSRYMSMSADGYGPQRYSLSSPMATLNGHQLASFISVNSEPGPDYGKFTVLEFSSSSGSESPSQVQNDIESDTAITEALTLQRGGNSRVVLGELEVIPVAGRLLYVEPVYTQSSGGASFPILRHVIALYGNGQPSFDNTLQAAIKDAIGSATDTG
jgi:uncharacterized membrane protein (UPF0182 family)